MHIKYLKLSSPINLEEIPRLWEQKDVLVFLIDLNSYTVFNTEHLEEAEIGNFKVLKTNYFKKRYAISRTILKYILWNILDEQVGSELSLYKNNNEKVCVANHNELHVSISYTRNIAALAISKIALGIDIERERKINFKNTFKYINRKSSPKDESMSNIELLRIWTLKEAYCKFLNKSMASIFNEELDLESVCHSSYILNNKYILSIVTNNDSYSLYISCLPKIDFFENIKDQK